MYSIKLTLADGKDTTHILKTRNKNIRQAVYAWKRSNKINFHVRWELSTAEPEPADDLLTKLIADCRNEETAKSYYRSIKKYKETGYSIDNLDAIYDYIQNLDLRLRERFVYAIIKAFKTLDRPEDETNIFIGKMRDLGRKQRGLLTLQRIESVMKPPVVAYMTQEEIKERASKYPIENTTHKFVALLYANEVPWRAETVVKITKDKKEKNMNNVRLGRKEIEFNNFKTAWAQGNKILPIDPYITSLMRKQFKSTRSNWLLPDPKDPSKHMTANTLTKIVIKIFGVGVTSLRHSYITHTRKHKTKEEFVDVCNRMMTSPDIGMLVYNDNKNDLHT